MAGRIDDRTPLPKLPDRADFSAVHKHFPCIVHSTYPKAIATTVYAVNWCRSLCQRGKGAPELFKSRDERKGRNAIQTISGRRQFLNNCSFIGYLFAQSFFICCFFSCAWLLLLLLLFIPPQQQQQLPKSQQTFLSHFCSHPLRHANLWIYTATLTVREREKPLRCCSFPLKTKKRGGGVIHQAWMRVFTGFFNQMVAELARRVYKPGLTESCWQAAASLHYHICPAEEAIIGAYTTCPRRAPEKIAPTSRLFYIPSPADKCTKTFHQGGSRYQVLRSTSIFSQGLAI